MLLLVNPTLPNTQPAQSHKLPTPILGVDHLAFWRGDLILESLEINTRHLPCVNVSLHYPCLEGVRNAVALDLVRVLGDASFASHPGYTVVFFFDGHDKAGLWSFSYVGGDKVTSNNFGMMFL